ncbi:MAG: M66 family metalloprotease [Gemmatimonadota bacterium]
MTNRTIPALLLVALSGAGCDDLALEPDRTPTSLRVQPDTAVVAAGAAVPFEVEVLDQHGDPFARIPSWAPPFWSSRRPALLEVDDGVATALAPGESRTDVEVAGLTASAVVRANPSELTVSVPRFYITQSVQRPHGDVPLIAGRSGVIRVFVQGGGVNFFRPTVRATFRSGDAVVHTELLELENPGLPETLDEGDLNLSYDGVVPATVFRPGLSMVLEIDPEGVVPAASGSVLRVPEAGELRLDVRETPPFRLRMVPVTQSANGRTSRLTPGYAARQAELMRDIFPFGEFDLDVRAAYHTEARLDTNDGWFQLIQEIAMLRLDDGSARYYYGGFDRPPGTTIGGLGYLGYPVSIGMDNRPDVIAHEVGHNMGLPHAPCGNPADADPAYPYEDGLIGQHGYGGRAVLADGKFLYDRERSTVHRPWEKYDLMSYCDPIWISDYNYEKVLAYRDTSAYDAALADPATGMPDGTPASTAAAPREPALVIQGGVHDGRLTLAPALEWQVPATAMKDGAGGAGPYTLEGLDGHGAVVFSLPVRPWPLAHGRGSHFIVAVPTDLADPARVERLRLSGPEGRVERDRAGVRGRPALPEVAVERIGARGQTTRSAARWDPGRYPLAVVRDRATGLIRAMSRTGRLTLPGDAERFDVLLSDGVRTRAARVVRR